MLKLFLTKLERELLMTIADIIVDTNAKVTDIQVKIAALPAGTDPTAALEAIKADTGAILADLTPTAPVA